MKVYVVTKQSKYDYDFSVENTKHGAFFNFDTAAKKLKAVVEDFKTTIKNSIEKYSDVELYPDEKNGLYTEYSETGYWFCSFGSYEHYECHQICVNEYEIEDYPKVSIDTYDGYVLEDDFRKIVDAIKTIKDGIMTSPAGGIIHNDKFYCPVDFISSPKDIQDALAFLSEVFNWDLPSSEEVDEK